MVAAGVAARIVEKLAMRSRRIYSAAAKAAGGRWTRLAGAAGSLGAKLTTRLNRVWVGVAVAVCGWLGISYASPEAAGQALRDWLLGTPTGLMVTAVGVSVVIIIFTRRR